MPAWLEWARVIGTLVFVPMVIILVILYSLSLRRIWARDRKLTAWHNAADQSLASLQASQRGLDEVLLAMYDDPEVKARVDERRRMDAAIIEQSLNAAGHDVDVDHKEAPEPRAPGDDVT